MSRARIRVVAEPVFDKEIPPLKTEAALKDEQPMGALLLKVDTRVGIARSKVEKETALCRNRKVIPQ